MLTHRPFVQRTSRCLLSCCAIFAASFVASTATAQVTTCFGHQHIPCDPQNIGPIDYFGDVAMHKRTAVIGKRGDSEGPELHGGALYIYQMVNGVWTEQAKLMHASPSFEEFLGESVAVHEDRAVGGAPGWSNSQGRIVVFKRNPLGQNLWSHEVDLVASVGSSGDILGGNAFFRKCVAVYDNVVAGGAPGAPGASMMTYGAGFVAVFRETQAGWGEEDVIYATDFGYPESPAHFGASVALQGDRLVIGEPDRDIPNTQGAGRVYILQYNAFSLSWQLEQTLESPNPTTTGNFGFDVAIEDDRIVIGARGEAQSYIYEHDGNQWTLLATLVPNDSLYFSLGDSVAISGSLVAVGNSGYDQNAGGSPSNQTGAVFLFQEDSSGNWNHVTTLLPEFGSPRSRQFGYSAALQGKFGIFGSLRETAFGFPSAPHGAAYFFGGLPGCNPLDPVCP